MRVVWKDSSQHKNTKQPLDRKKYKAYYIHKEPRGWVTNISTDNNIYEKYVHACNAINEYLGHKKIGKGRCGGCEIKIIGKKIKRSKKEEGLSI